MALIQLGHRLPVLRYLSTLAKSNGEFMLGFHSSSISNSSNTSGTDSSSGPKLTEEAGQPTSESPATSAPAAGDTTATQAEAPTACTSQPTTVEDDEEWTEVVHSSGQPYYWNQRTGETTQLGEPKPKSNRSGGSGGGGQGAYAGGGAGGRSGARGPEGQVDPRSEAPLEDRTGTYAAMGVIIGAFLGWVSQFV